MQIFITGTDTNIGKTLVSSWLCLHTTYDYFKPIQTGACEKTDSQTVKSLSNSKVYKESYLYQKALSPHLAARYEHQEIDINTIQLPKNKNLIVEGAGGLFVPINKDYLYIDLIKYFSIPVILVTGSQLGSINHTLLSLQALNIQHIDTIGIIVSGIFDQNYNDSIEYYGKTSILAQLPFLSSVTKEALSKILLPQKLQQLMV